jgi:hypothetical protein
MVFCTRKILLLYQFFFIVIKTHRTHKPPHGEDKRATDHLGGGPVVRV